MIIDLCWTSRKQNLDLFEAWSTRKWIWSQHKEITGVDTFGLYSGSEDKLDLIWFNFFIS